MSSVILGQRASYIVVLNISVISLRWQFSSLNPLLAPLDQWQTCQEILSSLTECFWEVIMSNLTWNQMKQAVNQVLVSRKLVVKLPYDMRQELIVHGYTIILLSTACFNVASM